MKQGVIENDLKEGDADSGVVVSEECNENSTFEEKANQINRSVSSVIKNGKYKSESRIPRMFKSRFSEASIKCPSSTKYKRISKTESKTLDQLRTKLSGKREARDRCSLA